MGISFGGLASGLDTQAIIQALVGLERRPISNLQRIQSNERAKLTQIGTLEGLVKSLREKAESLTKNRSFFSNKLNVGTEGVASFTVSGTAREGSHTLNVLSLAAADLWTLKAQGASDTNLLTDPGANGGVSFTYGGVNYDVTVDFSLGSGAGTLQTVADSINNDAAAGEKVTASVVNVGTDATPSYELLISGNDTGADFAISNLAVTNLDALGTTPDFNNERQASNAQAEVDGLLISRSSNIFDDVIEGVSFTVSRADGTPAATAQTTFGVSTDVEGIKSNIKSFLDEYNKVIDFIEKQEAYTEEKGAGGDLFGDSILRSVRGALQNGVLRPDSKVLDNTTDGFNSLGVLGIDLDSDGRLSINATKFDKKLSESLTDLADFFLEDKPVDDVSDKGILFKIVDSIKGLVDSSQARGPVDPLDPDTPGPLILGADGKPISVQGAFSRRRSTLQSIIDRIDDDISRKETALESFEADLKVRYSNLEVLIGKLNSQRSQLQASGF